jgi:hypothetical protein
VPDLSLDAAADELYLAPREEFTALRKRLAKAARDSGDSAVAGEIEKLGKPTTAAWLANQLARTDPAEVRALAELGDSLRRAHEELAGAELKALSQQRTELIQALVRQVASVSEHPPREAVIRELEEIFTAAVTNEHAAAALIAGRLTSAKGFAPVPGWPSWPAAEVPAARARSASRPTRTEAGKRRAAGETAEQALRAKRRAYAQQDLDEARAAVKEAEAARADEERALADADAAVDKTAAEVARLTAELDTAEAEEKHARGQAARVRRAVKEAERRVSQAWRQVQLAERKLAELAE